MTAPKATEWLRERQTISPPWGGADRASQIKTLIKPELLPEINRRLFAGTLAIGEVGLAAPTAVTTRLDDSSFVVQLHSGLMQLIYLMTRTLHSSSTDHGPGGVTAPALTHEQLVKKIAQIFLDWRDGKLSSKSAFDQHLSMPIHPQIQAIAHQLAVNADIFVLAHELGHVIMDGGDRDKHAAPAQWTADEAYADWIAVRIAFAAGRRLGLRMMYAGMLQAVRVFSFLERLGVKFAGPHLPPGQRLIVVKQMTREQCTHDIEFTHVSTIALSYDELLEGVENVLMGLPVATTQTVERVRVRLWAILEERIKESISHQRFIDDVKESMKDVDEATCTQVANSLREWLADPPDPAIPDPTGGRLPLIAGFLRAAIPEFPDPARAIFATAFPGEPAALPS
jgi:hypothetical protein